MPTRVLFVCSGNICRSPTAEAVMRHLVTQAGLSGEIEVDGRAPARGMSATRRTSGRRRPRHGMAILLTGRARQIEPHDFDEFDLVLAVDDENLQRLRTDRTARVGGAGAQAGRRRRPGPVLRRPGRLRRRARSGHRRVHASCSMNFVKRDPAPLEAAGLRWLAEAGARVPAIIVRRARTAWCCNGLSPDGWTPPVRRSSAGCSPRCTEPALRNSARCRQPADFSSAAASWPRQRATTGTATTSSIGWRRWPIASVSTMSRGAGRRAGRAARPAARRSVERQRARRQCGTAVADRSGRVRRAPRDGSGDARPVRARSRRGPSLPTTRSRRSPTAGANVFRCGSCSRCSCTRCCSAVATSASRGHWRSGCRVSAPGRGAAR